MEKQFNQEYGRGEDTKNGQLYTTSTSSSTQRQPVEGDSLPKRKRERIRAYYQKIDYWQ